MRILIVNHTSRFMLGGVTTETRQLLRGLREIGHTTALVTDAPFDAGEVAHYPIAGLTDAGLAAALKQALAEFEPDVVHVMSIGSPGVFDVAPLLADTPWLMTCHSLPPYERKWRGLHGHESLHYAARALRFGPNSLVWRWLLRGRRIPRIVAHSRFIVDVLTRYGYGAERISMIPLGFDLPDTMRSAAVRPITGGPLRLLTIGGLAHTKGQHDGVAALPALRARFASVEYRMIGEVRDDSYVAHLQQLARRLGVADSLKLTQRVSEAEKQDALAATDVYVQPSHEEGFCLAYIEAAAVVPRLVGADTGAIAAISADDAGACVVPVRAPQAMAAAIIRLAEREMPADLMRQRVERLGRSFGWNTYLEAHDRLYRDVAGIAPTGQ